VPLERLLSTQYADSLARSIDPARASRSVSLASDLDIATEPMETTHFSVVDAEGYAVSQTYTLEGGYGSGIVVRGAGFLLNNEMGDFNKKAGYTSTRGDIGTAPNLIAPGKRMLSSMTPVILARDDQLLLVTGSPGGRTIPNTVIDVVLGVTAFRQPVRAAVDARASTTNGSRCDAVRGGGDLDRAQFSLAEMGHLLRQRPAQSQGDAHSIWYDARTKTAYGAHDRRSPDGKASAAAVRRRAPASGKR
jgi:gamma-glutamyltranspeptidase/glutathione hydrolase